MVFPLFFVTHESCCVGLPGPHRLPWPPLAAKLLLPAAHIPLDTAKSPNELEAPQERQERPHPRKPAKPTPGAGGSGGDDEEVAKKREKGYPTATGRASRHASTHGECQEEEEVRAPP